MAEAQGRSDRQSLSIRNPALANPIGHIARREEVQNALQIQVPVKAELRKVPRSSPSFCKWSESLDKISSPE